MGCQITKKGGIRCGRYEATSVPGVFVAGNIIKDVQLTIVAAAEGTRAAFGITVPLPGKISIGAPQACSASSIQRSTTRTLRVAGRRRDMFGRNFDARPIPVEAVKALTYYAALIVIMRLAGKRLAGQTTMFDFQS